MSGRAGVLHRKWERVGWYVLDSLDLSRLQKGRSSSRCVWGCEQQAFGSHFFRHEHAASLIVPAASTGDAAVLMSPHVGPPPAAMLSCTDHGKRTACCN